ncbi:MAG: amino acid ABC transporter permease [Ancalomicrobiaceae bacterium]|nr:amino acid ABC transporter permease [Ancalomicrobiaceae bacterium]
MGNGQAPRQTGATEKRHWSTDPFIRSMAFQILTIVVMLALAWTIVVDTAANMARQHVAVGISFLWESTGFDLAQSLIDYSSASSIGRALFIGFLNTVLVAVLGIIFATLIGLTVGVARLSSNWLISRLATAYVEIIRNIPLLLQLFLWYFAVLGVLPDPKNSIQPIPGWVFLNRRGLVFPEVLVGSPTKTALYIAFAVAIAAAFIIRSWARRRQAATGKLFPTVKIGFLLIVGLPLLAFLGLGADLTLNAPRHSTFNISGGTTVNPELMAMLAGLTFYTASFIAETVRGGILAVSHGQVEAAKALGLSGGQTLNLVVLPQALRVIIPPLTNQYLNLTKNSSLAVAIGYPDLVYVGEVVFSKLGHTMEVIALWMVIYLGTSLITSVFMNWYNRRVAIVER